jgi:group I intron endonuclease
MSRGIYKLMNVISNKFYVGSAVDLKRRRARHFSELRTGKHNNRHLQAAWNKHGESAFIFVVVEEVPDNGDLLAAENRWLKDHVGKDYCYNIGVTALAPMLGKTGKQSPTWGYRHTGEAKNKISATSKARIQTESEKQKRRATMRGRPQPAEVRAKISATLSGEGNFWYGKQRPEHGEKVSLPVLAIGPTETTQYPSITALRAALGLKPPTVNRALKSGKPLTRGPFAGWSFRYATP